MYHVIIHIDFCLPLPKPVPSKHIRQNKSTEAGRLWLQVFFRFILGGFLVTNLMSNLGILVTRNARHGDQAHVYLIYSMW